MGSSCCKRGRKEGKAMGSTQICKAGEKNCEQDAHALLLKMHTAGHPVSGGILQHPKRSVTVGATIWQSCALPGDQPSPVAVAAAE